MFAVMGITGNVGGAIAKTLLQHGKKVRGVVRDQSKAQAWKDKGVDLVTANYDENLAAAFTDVEGVFVMIPSLPKSSFSLRSAAKKPLALVSSRPHIFLSRNSVTPVYLASSFGRVHSWKTYFTAFQPLGPPTCISRSISLLHALSLL